jgi:hypothetical protein
MPAVRFAGFSGVGLATMPSGVLPFGEDHRVKGREWRREETDGRDGEARRPVPDGLIVPGQYSRGMVVAGASLPAKDDDKQGEDEVEAEALAGALTCHGRGPL